MARKTIAHITPQQKRTKAEAYLARGCHQWDCKAFAVGKDDPINQGACTCGLEYAKNAVRHTPDLFILMQRIDDFFTVKGRETWYKEKYPDMHADGSLEELDNLAAMAKQLVQKIKGK